MRRRPTTMITLLGCGGLVMALTGCQSTADGPGDNDATGESSSAAVASPALEDGELQICFTGDYRPFGYVDPETEELEGIDVTLMSDLAETLAVDSIEWVQTTWSDLMTDFLDRCDLAVGGISLTEERAEQVAFTEPLIEGGKAAITTCGREEEFDTIEEINTTATTVITPIGGTNEEFADENFAEAEIIRFGDNNTIFDQIVAGDADVMVTDAPEVVWAAHEHETLCQVNADEPFSEAALAYMLPQNDTALQDAVGAWVEEIFTDGTWDAAVEEWFGADSVFAAEHHD